MCRVVALSIAEVISAFQLNWFPNAVRIADPVAVVVTGVGRSLAQLRLAVNTSRPEGIPVVLSEQLPTIAIAANTASMRVICIEPSLPCQISETARSFGTDSALLSTARGY